MVQHFSRSTRCAHLCTAPCKRKQKKFEIRNFYATSEITKLPRSALNSKCQQHYFANPLNYLVFLPSPLPVSQLVAVVLDSISSELLNDMSNNQGTKMNETRRDKRICEMCNANGRLSSWRGGRRATRTLRAGGLSAHLPRTRGSGADVANSVGTHRGRFSHRLFQSSPPDARCLFPGA